MADEPQKVDLESAGPARGKPEPKAPITDPPKEPPKPSEADKITPPPAEKKTGIGDITQNPKTAKESPLPAVDTGSKNKEPPKSKAPRGDKPQEPPKDIAGKGGNPKDKVVKFPDGGKENPKGKKDKVSQGSKGGSVEPPIVEPQEPTAPPRPLVEEKIVYLKLKELHPFHTYRKHPFQVRDNFKMRETAASIKERGVITPGIVRPEKDGKGYEIIAGHRRHRGSELAGFEDMPCIIRYNMSDHDAVQEMKDSNSQRDETLPSELAALLALEVEDIKHQGSTLKDVSPDDVGKRSVEIVGEMHGMNYKKVMRYIRLNELVPELLDLVDGIEDEKGNRKKGLGFMPAVELSYIKKKNQKLIAISMEGEQTSPSVNQAKRLRELDAKGLLTGDVIDGILSEQKKEVEQVIINTAELNKYFGEDATPRQMKDQILALLDEWKAKQPPEKNKPPKSAERS